jgi:hypothetical protein
VEVSRKHGSYDMRWPCLRNDPPSRDRAAAALGAAEVAQALDWDGFHALHFPGWGRHNAEARSAYAAYKQGREWRTARAQLSLVPENRVAAAEQTEREEAGTRRLMHAMAAAQDDRNNRLRHGRT